MKDKTIKNMQYKIDIILKIYYIAHYFFFYKISNKSYSNLNLINI